MWEKSSQTRICLNPYWQISGAWARTYYWKTHSIINVIIFGHDTGRFLEISSKWFFFATSFLMAHVGDKMYRWQIWAIGDGFGRFLNGFCHQHPLFLTWASRTNIQTMSSIYKFHHQHLKIFINITCHQHALVTKIHEAVIEISISYPWSTDQTRSVLKRSDLEVHRYIPYVSFRQVNQVN